MIVKFIVMYTMLYRRKEHKVSVKDTRKLTQHVEDAEKYRFTNKRKHAHPAASLEPRCDHVCLFITFKIWF